jgi:hypothetical protein
MRLPFWGKLDGTTWTWRSQVSPRPDRDPCGRGPYAEGASLPPSSASAYTNTTETEQYYEIESKPELIASSATEAERQRGETDFRPFYYRFSTHRPSRSRRSLELTFYRLTCCSFPYMLARLTSTKRSFLTKTDRTSYGRRAKSSRSHHWRRVVEDRLLNVVHHRSSITRAVPGMRSFSQSYIILPVSLCWRVDEYVFPGKFQALGYNAYARACNHERIRSADPCCGKYVNMYKFSQREKGTIRASWLQYQSGAQSTLSIVMTLKLGRGAVTLDGRHIR